MDWITGIQRAVDYAEENMTGEIDYEEAARRALSSSFHFQRVFGILFGYSFGDYIRMRRLSLAGQELFLTRSRRYRHGAQVRLRHAGELFPRLHALSRNIPVCGASGRPCAQLLPHLCETYYHRRKHDGLQD